MSTLFACHMPRLMLFFLVAASCSVKEVREDCPCVLSIYPDDKLESDVYRTISSSFSIIDSVNEDRYSSGSFGSDVFSGGKPCKLKIPKARVNLSCIFGIRKMKGDGSVLRISEGSQADSVYIYGSSIDCTGEQATDTLNLAKQWCSMRISFKKSDDWKPESCTLKSEWDGFDINTLLATKGDFSFKAEQVEEGSFQARIPRQGNDSLTLSYTYDNGHNVLSTKSFPIGEYIAKARYDWMKKNLDDLVVLIDRSEIRVEVVVANWEKGTDYGDIEY
ncbi:MAG: hypothetical protein LIR31_04415 [Bacteroidota bacterium]|nr:hypothetical protein [Bacteroidota bacterium]